MVGGVWSRWETGVQQCIDVRKYKIYFISCFCVRESKVLAGTCLANATRKTASLHRSNIANDGNK